MQLVGGDVRIAGHGEIGVQDLPLLGPDRVARPERRLLEEPVGDFARGAAADGVDAGDRQQVLHQRAGPRMVGALHRGQHAGLGERVRKAPVEDGRKVAPLREPPLQAPPPDLGQRERREQRVEQAGVAEPRRELAARRLRRLHGQREDLRVGRLDVLAPKAFEAGLEAFAAAVGLGPEDRAEIGIFDRRADLVRGQIGAADGDRIFGPEAQLLARGAGGQEQPAANLLARHVEKDRGRVQDGGLDALETRRQEMLERPLAGVAGDGKRGVERGRVQGGSILNLAASFNKAQAEAQPLSDPKVNDGFSGRRTRAPSWRGHGPMRQGSQPVESSDRSLPQPTFQTALRILRCLALVLMLVSVSRVAAQEQGPLDLEATGATLTAIENTLKQPGLSDAELQRLRADNDPLGIALQAAIADMAPRLAASTKRLAELTPKTDKDKAAAPQNDAAAAELATEKEKHDALDARLRAARALLYRVDDNATRISARRRALFARQTFARSASVFNPELWRKASREMSGDVAAVGAIVGAWASDLGGRVTAAQALIAAGAVLALALIAVLLQGIGRRFLDHNPAAEPPTRLRRALAAAWTLLVLAALPLIALMALTAALDLSSLSDSRVEGALDAVLDAARLLIVVNAVGRAMLSPRTPAWRLIPVGDRAARRIVRGATIIAAIWGAERLIEPAADAAASLNIVVAGRALGAALAALVVAYTLRRLQPAPQAAATEPDRWAPVRAVGWTCGLRRLRRDRDRLRRVRHLSGQPGDLPRHSRLLSLSDRRPRPGRDRRASAARGRGRRPAEGALRPQPPRARADRRCRAGRRAAGADRDRRGGRARALGRAVAGLVQLAARRLFRLRHRRPHPVAVVDAGGGGRVRRRAVRHAARPELAQRPSAAADALRSRRQQFDQHHLRLCRRRRRRAARGLSDRARHAAARHRRRRALGRHRLRPAVDRQQLRLRPDPLVGAEHPGRRPGRGRRRPGIRPPHQRPRDRDRDLRPGDR